MLEGQGEQVCAEGVSPWKQLVQTPEVETQLVQLEQGSHAVPSPSLLKKLIGQLWQPLPEPSLN